ncbi:restart primosome assembly protein PriB [Extensimonas vulgaris]|uniref:Restart primosome assembly protein PriB n=2 Tax=Extensimonas vulgaris TaxID=1031594 RepID=A0A369AVV3_9BURK|nr:restart primosome assembly protein PriB [Extensimonas vulgaris]TWI40489.1 restart primosome assembly protein PriB [Extensimonas vulgaris]TXD16511.1 primosomal replication protein N [Extensimonas vulgaris]
MRYTPAGMPAIAVRLEHESQQSEAGQPREVRLMLKAVAFGVQAERLAKLELGSRWLFSGFLATPRQRKQVVLHIQDMQPDPDPI